jgi:hypothetical protein
VFYLRLTASAHACRGDATPQRHLHLAVPERHDAIGMRVWDCAVWTSRLLWAGAQTACDAATTPNITLPIEPVPELPHVPPPTAPHVMLPLGAARVLEIGAGTGVVGIAVAALLAEGGRVIAGDLPAVLPHLTACLAANAAALPAGVAMVPVPLTWGVDADAVAAVERLGGGSGGGEGDAVERLGGASGGAGVPGGLGGASGGAGDVERRGAACEGAGVPGRLGAASEGAGDVQGRVQSSWAIGSDLCGPLSCVDPLVATLRRVCRGGRLCVLALHMGRESSWPIVRALASGDAPGAGGGLRLLGQVTQSALLPPAEQSAKHRAFIVGWCAGEG